MLGAIYFIILFGVIYGIGCGILSVVQHFISPLGMIITLPITWYFVISPLLDYVVDKAEAYTDS